MKYPWVVERYRTSDGSWIRHPYGRRGEKKHTTVEIAMERMRLASLKRPDREWRIRNRETGDILMGCIL